MIARLFAGAAALALTLTVLTPAAQAGPEAPPTVRTLPATGVSFTSATANGTVNPNGLPTTWWFQYDLTPNYTKTGLKVTV